MDEPYQEKHGAFLLKCEPTRDADGRYRPRLVATRLGRNGHEDVEIELPDVGTQSYASSAADYALNVGKRWVRDHVLPSQSDTTG